MNLSLSEQYEGQWLNIFNNFGIEKFVNKPCPVCGGEDRATLQDSGVLYCRCCGSYDPVATLGAIKGWNFKETADAVRGLMGDAVNTLRTGKKIDDKKPDMSKVNRLLKGAKSILGTPAEVYLKKRNCPIPTKDSFWQPNAWAMINDEPKAVQAMIQLIRSPQNAVVGVHKTCLTLSGDKPSHYDPKQITKAYNLTGAAIRLSEVTDVLGLTEGIENALSVYELTGVPTWACINNGMLENVVIPSSIKTVMIFSDRDESFTGQASAYALAKRLHLEGFNVSVKLPKYSDFNEDLKMNRRN